MQVSFVFDRFDGAGPVWRNGFWPIADVLDRYTEVEFVAVPPQPASADLFFGKVRKRLASRARLAGLLRPAPDPSGADVRLRFGIALNGWHVESVHAVDRSRDHHTHSVLYVSENVEPDAAQIEAWQGHDLIFCFCPELARDIEVATGVKTRYWPPHCDVLNLHSVRSDRPIDLMFMGRSDTGLLFHMQDRMLDGRSDLVLFDFVTRTNADRLQSAEKEFRLLADMHSRTRAVACFAAGDLPRYKGRSPLLGRWIYSWMSGAVVFGTAPRNPLARSEMDWPGAMVELPEGHMEATEVIETALADRDRIRAQSCRNVAEALLRHDTRHRLIAMFGDLGLKAPGAMIADADRARDVAGRLLVEAA